MVRRASGAVHVFEKDPATPPAASSFAVSQAASECEGAHLALVGGPAGDAGGDGAPPSTSRWTCAIAMDDAMATRRTTPPFEPGP
eukprot:scaffold89_cov318-Pavlova_lutheri.AAC.14